MSIRVYVNWTIDEDFRVVIDGSSFNAKPGFSAISMDSSINTLSILAVRSTGIVVFSR